MNRRKQNMSRWYLLGLAAILTAGCMLLSVGTTFARYRLDNDQDIEFESRVPVTAALGTVQMDQDLGENVFVPGGLQWKQTWRSDGSGAAVLDFTISNYLGVDDWEFSDMLVRLRLVGTLDSWDPNGGGELVIRWEDPSEEDGFRELAATVSPIEKDTALYHAFGEGWVFRFLDGFGQEQTWKLKGGSLTWKTMQITVDGTAFTGNSLLQLQAIGRRMD